jgi:hypothetical protein
LFLFQIIKKKTSKKRARGPGKREPKPKQTPANGKLSS